MTSTRIPFAFDLPHELAARAFGVNRRNAYVELDDERFFARLGPWTVDTDRANIRGAGVTGPYSFLKTAGPAHLSMVDRGLTFATNGRSGVCLEFRVPVRGMDPLGVLRHPGLTVTVQDPDALVAELTAGQPILRTDVERREAEQRAVDDLHTMSASELRSLADDLGIAHTSSTSRHELVVRIEAIEGDDLRTDLEDRSA